MFFAIMDTIKIPFAPLKQLFIILCQTLKFRPGNKEISPEISNLILHIALFVASISITKNSIKAVVLFQFYK